MSATTPTVAATWIARIRNLLPRGWFGEAGSTPVLDGITAAFGSTHAYISSWTAYARLQTRLETATDDFLDALCADFLGTRVSRNPGETDAAFRARIRREILRPKATRAALIQELTDLGVNATVFEPALIADTGTYGNPGFALGASGGWGSLHLPFQFLVTVEQPPLAGIPTTGGYGGPAGWGTGGLAYTNLSDLGGLKKADVYAAITSVIPIATVAWTKITTQPVVASVAAALDDSFILDESELS